MLIILLGICAISMILFGILMVIDIASAWWAFVALGTLVLVAVICLGLKKDGWKWYD